MKAYLQLSVLFTVLFCFLLVFSTCASPSPEFPPTEPESPPTEPEPGPWFDVTPYLGIPSADCQEPVTDLTGLPAAPNQLVVDVEKIVGEIDHNIWAGYVLQTYTTATNELDLPFWELLRQTGIFNYCRADNVFDVGISLYFIDYVKQILRYGSPSLYAPPLFYYHSGALYTEDEEGNPQYNFWFLDATLDVFVSHGLKPVLQLEYMPEDLVSENEKVRMFLGGLINTPNDHDEFRELIYQTARHCIERYGLEEVRTWYFTLREEPDFVSFFIDAPPAEREGQYYSLGKCPDIENPIPPGSMDSYLKMYDYFADGVKAADEQLKVGGPNIAFHDWFRPFIEHCVNETNFATGEKGTPLDAIFWHSYGPIDFHLNNAQKKLDIINQYPSLEGIPTIIDEWGQVLNKVIDGEVTNYEQGWTLQTNYDAAYLSRFVDGILNEPEDYPSRVMRWGEPNKNNGLYRYLSIIDGTHFVAMPTLNTFILLAKMGNEQVELTGGECGDLVHGFAARTDDGVQVLVYHFNETDEECQSNAQDVDLTITGLPEEWINVKRYQIDSVNSNAWTNHEVDTGISWAEYATVEAESKLKIVEQTDELEVEGGQVTFRFSLPPNSVSLIVIGEEAAPPELTTTPHVERLIREEAAYAAALKASDQAGFEQLVSDSFTSGGQQTTDPYSIWGKKALWALYTMAKSYGDPANADELRIRLLATTALNDVERFTLLNERISYLEAVGREDEIPALMEELELVKERLEYFVNWTRWSTYYVEID